MLGEATLDVSGTFAGEAIRVLILFAAQQIAAKHDVADKEMQRLRAVPEIGIARRLHCRRAFMAETSLGRRVLQYKSAGN